MIDLYPIDFKEQLDNFLNDVRRITDEYNISPIYAECYVSNKGVSENICDTCINQTYCLMINEHEKSN